MSILVTGGAGYIGSHMVLRLLEAGEQVVVYDNLSTGHRALVPDAATFIEADLADAAQVRECIRQHGVTDILHFAGSIIVPESVADPLKYYGNNTCISRSLIETAVSEGVDRFIFSATAAVYGAVGIDPVTEETPTVPVSPYGSSKLMTEWMLRDVAATGALRFGVLRYFNVAGADPKGRSGHSSPDATHLIKLACKAALGQRDFLSIYGSDFPPPDGTGVRDYIHVTDLAEAHYLLMGYLRDGGESVTLNCGYGSGYSVRQVAEMMKQGSGVDFELRSEDRRPGDPASVVADARHLRETLGWEPRHDDLRGIIQSAYDWELHLLGRA